MAAVFGGSGIPDSTATLPVGGDILVNLSFRVLVPDSSFVKPISFVWEECGDNVIAMGTINSSEEITLDGLAVSRTVLDTADQDITGIDTRYGGVGDGCLTGWLGATPQRAIDFSWGAIDYGNTCCRGIVGNIDCDTDELVDIGDLTELIRYLYISDDPLCCEPEANCDDDSEGTIDIGDLTALIQYLYIVSGGTLPDCQ